MLRLSISVCTPFLVIMMLTRIVLCSYSINLKQIHFNLIEVSQIFGLGFINDIATLLYFYTPLALITIAIPKNNFAIRPVRIALNFMLFAYIYALWFTLVSEFFFWDEFGCRFNFIAVDYLIYRREVIGNINESYPVLPILLALIALTSLIFYAITQACKKVTFLSRRQKVINVICLVLISAGNYLFYDNTKFTIKHNQFSEQLAQNGIYNLFAAFFQNSLDYQKFYLTQDEATNLAKLKELLKSSDTQYVSADASDITRKISSQNPPHQYNIMLISVESLSAEYLAYFGNTENITPFIDSILPHSMLFTKYYATGTRTVRGLEAMSLSIPPTAGNSILRRPHNEQLFSIGSVLIKEGYDNKFIYGGFGYFDNMNYFFSNNNFQVIDRASLNKEEISFANIWGVADEDIFQKAIREADKSFAQHQPFFTLIMTTSNHRPFTYPENKIDIPSGSGRMGAVKYTDYAIKSFIETARKKPWFDNTIFVITADHCAGSAGKSKLPADKYHIPLIIYSPANIKPQIVEKLSSQIDLAPTLIDFLGLNYISKFFGSNILAKDFKERAFIGTYQGLGYMKPGYLVVLWPKQKVIAYNIITTAEQVPGDIDPETLSEAISYYQSAYVLFQNGKLIDIKNTAN